MQHTLGVVKNAEALARNYPRADLLLLVTGALLHDVGKVEEYTFACGEIEQNVEGVLQGHVMLGCRIFIKKNIHLRRLGLTIR